jgi:hypothetical protein
MSSARYESGYARHVAVVAEVYSATQDVIQMLTPLNQLRAITACPSARHPGSCGELAAFRMQEPRQRDPRRKGYRRRSPTLDDETSFETAGRARTPVSDSMKPRPLPIQLKRDGPLFSSLYRSYSKSSQLRRMR